MILRFLLNHRFSSQQQQSKQPKEEERTFQEELELTQDRNTEPEPEYEQSTTEKSQSLFGKIMRYGFYTFLGVFSYQYYLIGKTQKPEQETGYIKPVAILAKKHKKISMDFSHKPFSKKLLPDPSFIVYGPIQPKTIVLNLSGTVIHTSFIMGTGHKVQKRPGLNQLLQRLSRLCELVILSDDDTFFVSQVKQNIDPDGQLFLRDFGRESMVYDKGSYKKDLRYLNRDLRNVIVIDNDPERLPEQFRDNAIFLSTFDGSTDDNELVQTLPLLESKYIYIKISYFVYNRIGITQCQRYKRRVKKIWKQKSWQKIL
ncbi:mitochondrial translocase complex component, putative [Ichthyophthirius multifiliis]|uniref:Mitochondrial import inner membrane translocase subunit TIM50 n=1 Tax=Ichthyophthirius multifiliis TaxID=5932 RepID=G0R6D5_ICHMU|nr:mitochondrial translocase complex component, putative [Ichthyophthirius multifiliis]EGR26971.1 mitochondrial translocase complex component, putative [Ichthyophthirius multifiliis]|eukprot:XP_004023855.1 mitochondrial translocase complex component, putative [Ichthyophthirius multifiliis]